MKMKDIPNDLSITIYKAIYRGILIAVSQNKDVLKSYMENIRNLNKNGYSIDKELINAYQYYSLYEDGILEELYPGLFLANIDIQIIEADSNHLSEDLINEINSISHLARLVNTTGRTKEDTDDFVKVIKHLNDYVSSNKTMKKLIDSNYRIHPILSCNIDEYLKYRMVFIEARSMNKMYNNACDKDY